GGGGGGGRGWWRGGDGGRGRRGTGRTGRPGRQVEVEVSGGREGVASAPSAKLIGQRLDRAGMRLELTRREPLGNLPRERSRLVDLVRVQDRLDRRHHVSADSELEDDGIDVLVGDIRVLEDTDVHDHLASTRKAGGLTNRIPVQAHRVILTRRPAQTRVVRRADRSDALARRS